MSTVKFFPFVISLFGFGFSFPPEDSHTTGKLQKDLKREGKVTSQLSSGTTDSGGDWPFTNTRALADVPGTSSGFLSGSESLSEKYAESRYELWGPSVKL